MKMIALYSPATGEVQQYHSVSVPSESAPTDPPNDAEVARAEEVSAAIALPYVFCGESYGESYVDLGAKALVPFPKKPAPTSTWSWSELAWLDDLAKVTAAATERIEAARVAATVAPIVYDGKRLDADGTAQENIKSKLATLIERERLGLELPSAMLVWRDADNVTHQFEDQGAYRAWLGGLAAAIDDRGTAAYGWAWRQKALRDAAVLAGDVVALQVLPGPLTTPQLESGA